MDRQWDVRSYGRFGRWLRSRWQTQRVRRRADSTGEVREIPHKYGIYNWFKHTNFRRLSCGLGGSVQYSSDGLHLTKQFESCRLSAYLDSKGVPTIGWGHTFGVDLGDTCTQVQADEWLRQDVQWATQVVNAKVSVPLT